ncbi:hypothetical protein LPJ72_005946, partial [Coemansia sp. Benny D160-2]
MKQVNVGIQRNLSRLESTPAPPLPSSFRYLESSLANPLFQTPTKPKTGSVRFSAGSAQSSVESTPHSLKNPTGSSARERYKSIGQYMRCKIRPYNNVEQLLEYCGFELPDLGSVSQPDSPMKRIRARLWENYSRERTLTDLSDNLGKRRGLRAEQFVQCGMNLLLQSIYDVLKEAGHAIAMRFWDTSSSPIESASKPDFVFVPHDSESIRWEHVGAVCELKSIDRAEKDILHGQIGHYFNKMWETQPRKHCLGLVSSKDELHIMINTRNAVNQAVVGRMPFIDRNDGCVYTNEQYSDITLEPDNGELVVRVLAMILSLDFKQRGLLVPQRHGVFGSPFGLGERMPTIDQEEAELTIEIGDTQLSSCLIRLAGDGYLGGRSMFPVGTTSWVHRADVLVNTSQSYHNGAAVVKFLWRRTARSPEREVYSMLEEMGVPNIPKVIFGGQVENCVVGEGFVCDILVLEACGGSINSYIRSLAGGPATNIWRLLDVACGYIHTIYAAWSGRTHRFLHRDISSGNLLVENNRARVIDWEYGLKVDVKAKRTDISSDPLTGTM